MELMLAFGWIGVMLLAGVLLRAKIGFMRSMLVPSCVIGGIIGFILINTCGLFGGLTQDGGLALVDPMMYNKMVGQLFTISFISIGLTGTKKEGNETSKNVRSRVLQGALGMGLTWTLLYALTAFVGYFCIALFGKPFGMNGIYGMTVQFAFCQGPGQAATYGTIMEKYGWPNASMVGVTFAALGFLYAFVVGVPIAKRGIKKGLAKYSTEISGSVSKGLIPKDQQKKSASVETTHTGNIDALALHFAFVMLVYVITFIATWVFVKLVPPLKDTVWGMMFMNGMLFSYLVKWILKKAHWDYLIDDGIQSRITGWSTDFLIVAAFMSVKLSVIGSWMIPIMLTGVVIAIITYVVCFYFGARYGGSNDFERTLGLWGVATGTVPSGIALVRIVDPDFNTSTAVELGAMNVPMMICLVTVFTVLATAAGTLPLKYGVPALLIPIPVILILMKLLRVWGKKTFSMK